MPKNNQTSTAKDQLTVIISSLNGQLNPDRIFESIELQSLRPAKLLIPVRPAAKPPPFPDSLPVEILPLENQEQDAGREQTDDWITKVNTDFVALLDARFSFGKEYLNYLHMALLENPAAGAAGGAVSLAPELNSFQKTVWLASTHIFGGKPFTRQPTGNLLPANPLCRTSTLKTLTRLENLLPVEAQPELFARLRCKNYPLLYRPDARQFYHPTDNWRTFTGEAYARGKVSGRLARCGLIPDISHWREDKIYTFWTFFLFWNPAGWGIVLLDLILSAGIAINQARQKKADLRLFFLFPLMHAAGWLGWLSRRFYEA